jgi:hypothetical protein
MDPLADLVRQLEPQMPPPPLDLQARQRDALLQSIASSEKARMRPPRWHTRHRGWFVAIGGAAAAAVVVAILVPRSSPSPRPPAHMSVVLTAVTRALAATGNDIEEVQSTVPGTPLSTTSWVDLSTGACRTDTSLNGQPSLTISVEHGKAVFVDYGLHEWWTRSTGGVSCEPLTPQTIERNVSTGDYTVAGRSIVGGQPSLKLVSTSTTTGPRHVTKLTTLWVNATTYLPIQSTSGGHFTEQTMFTWRTATPSNTAVLDVKVPASFPQVAAPPPERQAGG